tara:strand:- start:44011 stop:44349 length:339 start_codon:yes stop_codon:yes gene_type:complete
MGLLNNYKVKASSLTESIIAMVIIATCLSIAIMIYVRVLTSDKNIASYKAEQKVKELLFETSSKKEYTNEEYTYETFKIRKEVEELVKDGPYKVIFIVDAGHNKNKYQYIIE